jgi:hypothetical protein
VPVRPATKGGGAGDLGVDPQPLSRGMGVWPAMDGGRAGAGGPKEGRRAARSSRVKERKRMEIEGRGGRVAGLYWALPWCAAWHGKARHVTGQRLGRYHGGSPAAPLYMARQRGLATP